MNEKHYSVVVPWNMVQYSNDSVAFKSKNPPGASQSCLAAKYPNPQIGNLSGPTTIISLNGHIIAWHLPNVIDKQLQVRISYVLPIKRDKFMNLLVSGN